MLKTQMRCWRDQLHGRYVGTADGAAPGAGRWELPGGRPGRGDVLGKGGAPRGRGERGCKGRPCLLVTLEGPVSGDAGPQRVKG